MTPMSPFNTDPHDVMDPDPNAPPGTLLKKPEEGMEVEAEEGAEPPPPPKYANYVEYFKVRGPNTRHRLPRLVP